MFYPLGKRLFDFICAGIGLLLLAPVGLVLGLLVKFSDGGPVFYGQTRIGLHGRPFRIWKFRSMVVNADRLGGTLTKDEDPRITKIGRWLRKLKLDELPQLWNVLTGEMSLVGPRPEVPRYVQCYTPEQRRILNLKPGITDLATMLFRNEEELLRGTQDVERFYLEHCLPRKIELNLQYAERAGFLPDLWIILQTLCPYWLAALMFYAVTLMTGFWLAYGLRSDFQMSQQDYDEFRRCLVWILWPQLICLSMSGQVRGLMSYFSIPDLRRIAAALSVALVLQLGLCSMLLGGTTPKISILLLDFVLSFFMLCALRMCLRIWRERFSKTGPRPAGHVRRVAIIGAGEAATNLALDLASSSQPARQVVAFFDDNPRTWNKRPHDIPVFGMPECLLNPEWLKKIDEVIVALPEEDSQRRSQITDILKPLPLKVIQVPGWLT